MKIWENVKDALSNPLLFPDKTQRLYEYSIIENKE